MDFNSLWPRRCGNILGTWELRYKIRGFIVTDGNQIANFETKTMSLISKFDSKFANFASKLEKQLYGMASAEEDESDKSWLSTFKHQIDLETFT